MQAVWPPLHTWPGLVGQTLKQRRWKALEMFTESHRNNGTQTQWKGVVCSAQHRKVNQMNGLNKDWIAEISLLISVKKIAVCFCHLNGLRVIGIISQVQYFRSVRDGQTRTHNSETEVQTVDWRQTRKIAWIKLRIEGEKRRGASLGIIQSYLHAAKPLGKRRMKDGQNRGKEGGEG